jgi:hypothetical protein
MMGGAAAAAAAADDDDGNGDDDDDDDDDDDGDTSDAGDDDNGSNDADCDDDDSTSGNSTVSALSTTVTNRTHMPSLTAYASCRAFASSALCSRTSAVVKQNAADCSASSGKMTSKRTLMTKSFEARHSSHSVFT